MAGIDRKRGCLLIVAAAFLSLAGVLGLSYYGNRHEPAPEPPAEVLFARQPVTLAPRIHMLGRLFPSVAYAIETSQGLVLVDSGLEPDAATLREQLAELGLDVMQLRAIFLTHAHGDHTLGARSLRELTGAKIYAGQGDSDVLRAGGPRDAFFSTFPMDAYAIHATPVDVELTGGEVFDLGDTQIEAIATPGHTPGSTCYLVRQGDLRALCTGDTVSSLVVDVGTYAVWLAPRYRSDPDDYLQTLLRLRDMPVPELVLPGHPAAGGMVHGPRLTADQWRAVLDRGLTDVRKAISQFDRDGADFLDGQAKELLPGLHYLGDYASRAVYVWNAPHGQFLFDAPGDAGLIEFLRQRLPERGLADSLRAVVLTSCDAEATGGLGAVVEAMGCAVVTPEAGREAIARQCREGTEFLSPVDWSTAGDAPVEVIPLTGESSPVAYLLTWKDKRVLISGTIPVKVTKATTAHVTSKLRASPKSRSDYFTSLQDLAPLQLHLWLPAQPAQAQNANLYGEDWETIIEQNFSLVSSQ